MKTVHVIVSGRVQGVWYRGWTVDRANSLNITGWVRNRRDGTVEAMFSGDDDDVDQMLNALHDGPPLANVLHIDATAKEYSEFNGFRQLPTV